MIKKILIGLVIVIVILVVIIALQPKHYHIERSTTINAAPATVFAQVNDFHKWDAWSPWAKMDPAMKANYDGAPAGAGAGYSWVGNSQVGEGRMTITESHPPDRINIKLEFIKPFAATDTTVFPLKPQGNQTTVLWSLDGDNNFIGKAFGLVMSMDKMVGNDFDRGLAQLKSVSEAAPKP